MNEYTTTDGFEEDPQDDRTRVEMLETAKMHLEAAYDLVGRAVAGRDDEFNIKAYYLDHLKIMTSDDHGFLSRDYSIDTIIGMLAEDPSDGDCEE